MKNLDRAFCIFTILSILCLFAKHGTAGEETDAFIDAQSAFEKLKGMVGEWRGTVQNKSNGPAVEVRYKLTAHQTAVMETLFPDTEHEMITMYYLDGDQLMATHYCAMGNQPRFRFSENSTPNEFFFQFGGGGQNLNAGEDMHMHSGRITFVKEDQVESEWEIFNGGKREGSNRFYIKQVN
jgi:hypothetical protein